MGCRPSIYCCWCCGSKYSLLYVSFKQEPWRRDTVTSDHSAKNESTKKTVDTMSAPRVYATQVGGGSQGHHIQVGGDSRGHQVQVTAQSAGDYDGQTADYGHEPQPTPITPEVTPVPPSQLNVQ